MAALTPWRALPDAARAVTSGLDALCRLDPLRTARAGLDLATAASVMSEATVGFVTSGAGATLDAVGLRALAPLMDKAGTAVGRSIRLTTDANRLVRDGSVLIGCSQGLGGPSRRGADNPPTRPLPSPARFPTLDDVGRREAQLGTAIDAGLGLLESWRDGNGTWDTPFVGGAAQTAFGVVALSAWGFQSEGAPALARFLLDNRGPEGGYGWSAQPTRSTHYASLLCGYALEQVASLLSEEQHGDLKAQAEHASRAAFAYAHEHPDPAGGRDTHYSLAARLVLDTVAPDRFDTLPNLPWLGRMSGLGFDLAPELSRMIVGVRAPVETLFEEQALRQGGAVVDIAEAAASSFALLAPMAATPGRNERINRIKNRQDADGSWDWVLVNSAVNLIALRALGVDEGDPFVVRGLRYVDRLTSDGQGRWTRGDAWDTATLSATVGTLRTELPSAVRPAVEQLVSTQLSDGRWSFTLKGRLGDNDTTSVVLQSLNRYAARVSSQDADRMGVSTAVWRAVEALLAQQQESGGWGAFAPRAPAGFRGRPLRGVEASFVDEATPSVTARVISALLSSPENGRIREAVDRARDFLLDSQGPSGVWWCKWFAGWFPSAAWVLPALMRAGVDPEHPAFQKARRYLLSVQNDDGGFGEPAEVDIDPNRAGSGESTPFQTACALVALLCALRPHGELDASVLPAIDAAAAWLIASERGGCWSNGVPLYTATRGVEYYDNDAITTNVAMNALMAYRALLRDGPSGGLSALTL